MSVLSKPVRSIIALVALIAPFASQAADKDFCQAMEKLGALARNDFAAAPAPEDAEPLFTVLDNPGAPPDCKLIAKTGGLSHMCMWTFEYRSAHSNAGFANLFGLTKQCLGSRASELTDVGVNHPDSYEAANLEIGGIRYSVSIKDKASHQKTYVFLWVEKAEQSP